MTPLHLAALHGHTNVVKYLLEMGADALAKDQKVCAQLKASLLAYLVCLQPLRQYWTGRTYAYENDHFELHKFLHNLEEVCGRMSQR